MAESLAEDSGKILRTLIGKPATVIGLLALCALALTLQQLSLRIPLELVPQALWAPDLSNASQVLVHNSFLPRTTVAVLAGAALGLAGSVLQQVLRNPLASPTTLGVSAGAQIALAMALVWAPSWLEGGREAVALAGSCVAALVVFGLAWRQALSPVALILAGLIVNLYFGAVEFALTLFHQEQLISLFIWGAGSLIQNDWSGAVALSLRLALVGLALALMVRPLSLLELDDRSVQSLGVSLTAVRLLSLGLATALSASVVSTVGVIGFVGLAAPALVRLLGARRFRDRLIWAPLMGAALLWLTDILVRLVAGPSSEIPTGALTAVVGAPLLLWLLPQLRRQGIPSSQRPSPGKRMSRYWMPVAIGVPALLLLTWIGLALGRSAQGWHWDTWLSDPLLFSWRYPRLFGAMAAGALLALAGTALQRFSGNPMASPEVLGVSSGAAMGVVAAALLFPAPSQAMQVSLAALGAFTVLVAILVVSHRSDFSPERMLLAGIAVSTIFGTVVTVLMATGDPRLFALRAWMAGSTYRIAAGDLFWAMAVLGLALGFAPLVSRWLDVMPLGEVTARGVGIDIFRSRLVLLLLTAAVTASATLIVGPVSFVGLMAPHMARMMGLSRALPHLLGAALLGAGLMCAADWMGRNLLFPYQLPAGLAATFIGGPYLLWLLGRRTEA